MSCGENGCEVGRERQSRLAGTDAERDWDWMWCDGITHHPRLIGDPSAVSVQGNT